MLHSRTVTATSTATNLATLLDTESGCTAVILQAGAATVQWGSRGSQSMALTTGLSTDVLPLSSLSDLYVTGSNTLNVMVFR